MSNELKWPMIDDNTGDTPCVLTSVEKGPNGDIIVSKLSAAGIPVVKSYPMDGRLGNVILGTLGAKIDLLVPSSMLEEAKSILSDEEFSDEELEKAIEECEK